MVHPYLKSRERLREGKEIHYPYDELKPALERTLGVPIFQEQVMQIAMIAAGYTPGQADQLRRDMAAWKRSGNLDKHREPLITGMLSREYDRAFAERIFEQIKGFGDYGFPESHSHSFALLAYVSAWLKQYEPAAFTAALLNSQPMGFYAPAQLVRDAQRHGVEVRPVSVLHSDWDCTLEIEPAHANPPQPPFFKGGSGNPAGQSAGSAIRLGSRFPPFAKKGQGGFTGGHPPLEFTTNLGSTSPPLPKEGQGGFEAPPIPALRLGLRMVKGLSQDAAKRLTVARSQAAFDSIDDLARRVTLDRRDLDALAAADALDGLAQHRAEARWLTAGIERPSPLLADAPIREQLPSLAAPTEGRDILEDYASVGLTLRRHPVALLRPQLQRLRLRTADELRGMRHGQHARAAGIVINRQRPGTAKGTVFVTLEDETGYINVVIWNDLVQHQRRELLSSRLMGVEGVLERQGEVIHLVARRLTDHTALLGQLRTHSRDFH
jgi:error-prone DNA polymerase